jgi:hypothetical protein
MHLLRFSATLNRNAELAEDLRKCEELIRSVMDFVCDLLQNSVDVSNRRERSCFQPEDFPTPRESTCQWREVFDQELREIDQQRSRRTYATPTLPIPEKELDGPNAPRREWSERLITGKEPRHRIGLAFSGGGIRSATFNLGVLQGLQELDLLRHVDYLSTVSGGGFIGSWLAGNVRRTRHWLGKATCWDASIAHLRSYSNYLAPRTGILSADTWTLGASWIRNALLVQLTGLAWLVTLLTTALSGLWTFKFLACSYPHEVFQASLMSALLPGKCFSMGTSSMGILSAVLSLVVTCSLAYNFVDNRVQTGHKAPRAHFVRWFTVVPSWFGAFIIASMLWSNAGTGPWTCHRILMWGDYSNILKQFWWQFSCLFIFTWIALFIICWIALTPVRKPNEKPGGSKDLIRRLVGLPHALWIATLCTGVLYLELCAILYLYLRWFVKGEEYTSVAFVVGPVLVLLAFTISVVLLIGCTGRRTNEAQREWWTRFGAWLTMYSVASLALVAAAVCGPVLIMYLYRLTSDPHKIRAVPWAALVGWLGTVIGGLFAGRSSKTGGDATSRSMGLEMLAKAGGLLFIVGSVLATSTLLYLFIRQFSNVNDVGDPLLVLSNSTLVVLGPIFGVVLGCGLLFSWCFEINIFGLNQFYRNRLVRCYLGATRWTPGIRMPHPFTKFDFKDDMPLSNLKNRSGKDDGYRGPFPIFNCALNMAGSSDLALNTRHSASFSLTPLFCGADRPKVGYAQTGNLENRDSCFSGGVMLGQAVAISGAAASPNMGYNTSPLVAFLLTMFNVRLGWWFPNPGEGLWNTRGLPFSLYYLTRELLGLADETRSFLNVSDGGHFENLGVYELIRRRCKVIIACDAECDEALQFGSLGNMIRICETDFGAIIDIDVKSIRQQKEGHSLAHCTVGKIKYDNGSLGYLIYLKASITGDEEVGIAQYRSTHPSFPHETTADQFFSEGQFDSYRKLGQHVVRHSFRGTQEGENPIAVAERLGDVLVPAGCSSESFLKHTQTLEHIWEQFRLSPNLHGFLDELMLIHPPVASVPRPRAAVLKPSEEHAIGLQLLQLMEDVFMDLRLEDFWEHPDNRGWAIMFMRWARSPRFQDIWRQTHRTFGIRFEYFCAARLGLSRDNPVVRV